MLVVSSYPRRLVVSAERLLPAGDVIGQSSVTSVLHSAPKVITTETKRTLNDDTDVHLSSSSTTGPVSGATVGIGGSALTNILRRHHPRLHSAPG